MSIGIKCSFVNVTIPDELSVQIPSGKNVIWMKKGSVNIVVGPLDLESYRRITSDVQSPPSDPDRMRQAVTEFKTNHAHILKVDSEVNDLSGKLIHRECQYYAEGSDGHCSILVSSGVGARGFSAVQVLAEEMISHLLPKNGRSCGS